jgi:hypothetical protein
LLQAVIDDIIGGFAHPLSERILKMKAKALARWALLVVIAALALTGCGSSTTTSTTPNNPGAANQPQITPDATTSTTETAIATTPTGPPGFTVHGATPKGDEVRIEGWLGPPSPVNGSEVQQAAVEGCAAPASDGRAVIVRLDLTTTIESSLSGEVELAIGLGNEGSLPYFLLGTSQGAVCDGREGTTIHLGTLQPGQPSHVTVWLVLADAVSPKNPQPTQQSLAEEGWAMAVPTAQVNGELVEGPPGALATVEGPQFIKCEDGESIALIAGTPAKIVCPFGNVAHP